MTLTREEAQDYLLKNISFTNNPIYSRVLRGKQELLHKAMGYQVKSIWDLTLGRGEDAWVLVRLGFEVQGWERDAFLFQCLERAHEEAILESQTQNYAQKLKINFGDFLDLSEKKIIQGEPDCCYLDPMFELSLNKSALPKKDMQILRTFLPIQSQGETEALFKVAFEIAKKRVVVKRSRHAPPLKTPINHQVLGKSFRFDIYLKSGHLN